jgi:hypothetical protein
MRNHFQKKEKRNNERKLKYLSLLCKPSAEIKNRHLNPTFFDCDRVPTLYLNSICKHDQHEPWGGRFKIQEKVYHTNVINLFEMAALTPELSDDEASSSDYE